MVIAQLEDSDWGELGSRKEFIVSSSNEYLVKLEVWEELFSFLIDTVATYLVMAKEKYVNKKVSTVGVTCNRSLLQPMDCVMEGRKLDHQFLYMPDCLLLLLGRDIESRTDVLWGQSHLMVPKEEGWRMQGCMLHLTTLNSEIPLEVEDVVMSWVWGTWTSKSCDTSLGGIIGRSHPT